MRRMLVVVLALLLSLPFAAMSAVADHHGTPEATPVGGQCVAPEIPPGTPTPMEDMMGDMGMEDPAATPDADDHAGMAMDATPEGEDEGMALPPVQEPFAGEPASEEVAAAAEEAFNNLVNCANAGMWLEFGALHTPSGLMEECGTDNIYDTEMCMSGLPGAITLISADNAQVLDDGRIAIDVTFSIGSWLIAQQQVFVEEGDFLLADTVVDLVPEAPAGATEIDVELVDYAFEMSDTTAPAGDIVFNVTNTGAEPHELVMLSLPEGVEIMDLLESEDDSLFAQITFYGAVWAMPGESGTLVLTGMEPGTYTVVCFIPTAEGVPHVVEGMIAEFEVTEP
jgi:uncharacterized cupredoxin-like copper-binding protein